MAVADIAGVRIAYEVHGAGEPIVLAASHGIRKEAWRTSLVPPLVDAGYRVVTFDTRGIGESDAPPPPYSVAQIAMDVAGLIEHLDIAPCRMVGFSLGGFVAEELSSRRPGLVRAAAFLASAGPISTYGRLVIATGLELAASGVELPRRERIKHILAEILTPAQLQDDAFVGRWIQLFEQVPPMRDPGRHGQYAAIAGWLEERGVAERWAAIAVPVLVVAFEHDVIFPPSSARLLADAVGCELIVVREAAHGGPLTHAAAVAERLIEFFAHT